MWKPAWITKTQSSLYSRLIKISGSGTATPPCHFPQPQNRNYHGTLVLSHNPRRTTSQRPRGNISREVVLRSRFHFIGALQRIPVPDGKLDPTGVRPSRTRAVLAQPHDGNAEGGGGADSCNSCGFAMQGNEAGRSSPHQFCVQRRDGDGDKSCEDYPGEVGPRAGRVEERPVERTMEALM